jgi:opacity protein-like surface antigen
MDRFETMRSRGKGFWIIPALFLAAFILLLCSATSLRAEEGEEKHESLQAGVLEIAGSTSFAVNYQKEGDRETTHLRLTPSIGYFILDPLEVQLRASYIFDNVHESSVTDDRSQGFLFTLGPAYNFRGLSDVLIPYLGIDFGTYYQHLSTSVSSRSGVQLALGMGAGLRWMFTENLGLKLGFQYVHGFGSDDIGDTDFLGLEIGISLFIPTWPTY